MAKTCITCGASYDPPSFSLDTGKCGACVLRRWQLTPPPGPATTRELWWGVLFVHAIYGFVSLIILCSDIWPLCFYSFVVICYCLVKITAGAVRGYPSLTSKQQAGLLLFPAWGLGLTALLTAGLLWLYEVTGILPYLEAR